MKGKKAIFLFLALLLPVSVFVFLKLFGKNEFDVPALYQTEQPVVPNGCIGDYQIPYRVPDTVLSKLAGAGQKALYIVYYGNARSSRIQQEIIYDEVVFVKGEEIGDAVIKKCVFLPAAFQDLIVIDKSGSIRGYYNSADREDVDRLLLELEILLKKY